VRVYVQVFCLLGSVELIVARVLLSLAVIERVNVYMFYFVGEKLFFLPGR
jgi:hypothetical protein